MGSATSKAAEPVGAAVPAPILLAVPVVLETAIANDNSASAEEFQDAQENEEQNSSNKKDDAEDEEDSASVLILPPSKKQRLDYSSSSSPPVVEPLEVSSPLPSSTAAHHMDSPASSTTTSHGLVTLNVRGTLMEVPRATLMEIPWFEALLSRWNFDDSSDYQASASSLTRDRHGHLYIDDHPLLFRALVNHARNVSRPSPLALSMTTPRFDDDPQLEQEFRLMVDQYGLTDVFYSFSWYQAEWVCTEQAARCEITSCCHASGDGDDDLHHHHYNLGQRLVLPYSIESWVNDKPHVIKTGNNTHNRQIKAYDVQIGNANKLDWLDFGWMSESTRTVYKVRLHRPKLDDDTGRRSMMYTCMEEDLNSVGETRMDNDSISIPLPEDGASVLQFRLERKRMKFSFHGNLFWSAGETPANDLVPWIYHCGEEGSAVEITKIEIDT